MQKGSNGKRKGRPNKMGKRRLNKGIWAEISKEQNEVDWVQN